MCSSDGQRMFEAAAVGSLMAGGPLVAVLGMGYNLYVLGPTSLLGSAVFILFYPTMVSFLFPVLRLVLICFWKSLLTVVNVAADVQLQTDSVLQEEGSGCDRPAGSKDE